MSRETILTFLIVAVLITAAITWTFALCKAASKPTPEDENDG